MFTLSFISIILKLLNAMDAFSHEMRSRFHTKKYNNNFELKTNVKKNNNNTSIQTQRRLHK